MPIIKRMYWKLRWFSYNLVFGGRPWALFRLLVVLSITGFWMVMGALMFGNVDSAALAEGLSVQYPFVRLVHPWIVVTFQFIISGRFLRYLWLPSAAFVGAFMIGARYIQQTYHLPRYRLGLRYLKAAFFGLGYPSLEVEEGKKKLTVGEVNLVDVIGGPGNVKVKAGNVVVFERPTGPSAVRGAGTHFISRLEMVKDTASLDDQHGMIEAISATTKDGIEVRVCDVHFRYRLLPDRRSGGYPRGTLANPYPFSIKAATNMAYSRIVVKGELGAWHGAVQSAVNGVINEYVSRHRFDFLTSPGYLQNPRRRIAEHLRNKETRGRLRNLGAELLWFDIGRFDVADARVKDQRVEAWQAKWVGNARVERAYGEAQRMAYQEIGRAEAQAEMLMSIVHALDGIDPKSSLKQNLRNVILVRTAQILDALAERPQPATPPKEPPAKPPEGKPANKKQP